MQWEGKIGPSFIVIVVLAALTGVQWAFDARANVSERVAVIETQMKYLVGSVGRLENKLDKPRAQ